jgi:ATP-dependent RNA helicase DDX18/HAS1
MECSLASCIKLHRPRYATRELHPDGMASDDFSDNWDPSFDYDNEQDVEEPIVLKQPDKATSHFFSQKSLLDPSFQVDPMFEKLCQGIGILQPSKIQSMAWPVILSGKHAIVAEQTGSGKTLAYLIPLLRTAFQTRSNSTTSPGAPRILVLAPTAELADQIKSVTTKLTKHVKLSSMVITASGKYQTSIRDQIRMLQRQPVDIVISTPGRIATILRAKKSGLDLSQLQALVLDEVDVLMLDETFGPQLRTIGAAAPVEQTQFVFVTATLPDAVVKKVEREFPGVVQVLGPGLHRVAPTVKERLVDVSVPSRSNRDSTLGFEVKAKELQTVLRQTKCPRTLIFCNTIETCRQVENLLTRKDRRGRLYNIGAYHNAMTPEARNEQLTTFAHGSERNKDVDYILVCTDRAARGVDFDAAPVDHVVLFDFPSDPADYVR